MYAVFADGRFEGLYKSLPAAKKLVKELNTLPVRWHEKPTVEECDKNSTFRHRKGTAAAIDASIAVEWNHFGRCKHNRNLMR